MRSGMIALIGVVAGTAGGSAVMAQSNGEAAIYSQGHFKGFRMPIYGPTRSMSPIVVKSIEVPPGTAWDLCSGNSFSGCTRFTQSKDAMALTVRSVRPVAAPIPEGATIGSEPSSGPLKGSGTSLRGFSSEFFVMPAEGGNRIEVGPGSAPLQRATEFCRAHGWRVSPYQREQAVAGRNYLADVLCADTQ